MQREQAAATARERGFDGWAITLQAPSYGPFMMYANSRELRRRLYMAYNTKCTHDDAYNNFGIVRRLVNLRRELAQLLGYSTYADYALQRRMAASSANVYRLFDELIDAYRPAALAEVADVERKARQMEEPGFELQPWDFAYYSHKLQLERYDLDPEMLRPYFELARVKEGVFGLAHRLYGITFRPNPDIPVYHPDVTAYDVLDADAVRDGICALFAFCEEQSRLVPFHRMSSSLCVCSDRCHSGCLRQASTVARAFARSACASPVAHGWRYLWRAEIAI